MMITRQIMITAFNPFGELQENPSQRVLESLLEKESSPCIGQILPTEFTASVQMMEALIQKFKPRAVIMLGVAETRAQISLERFALNIADARIPDNAGYQPRHQAIVPQGPPAYQSGLPLEAIHAALQAARIPVTHSYEAGTFVCNHLFYRVCHHLQGAATRAGFIHLPGFEAIPLGRQVQALSVILETVENHLAMEQAMG